MSKLNFTLIGPGAVGRALTRALVKADYRLLTVIGLDTAQDRRFARALGVKWSDSLSQLPAETGLIIAAVPDSQLRKVAAGLARQKLPWKKIAVLHTAGALGAEVFTRLEGLGAGVGACHPFMTFPPKGRPPRLEGVTFGIDGNAAGLRAAQRLVRSLHGKPLEVSGQQRVLYHLAAVLACGMVAANLLMAQQVLSSLGMSEKRALEAIIPISAGTINNIKELGVRAAMTGPAVRGDTTTIRRHLQQLQKLDPELAKVYREISKWVSKRR